MKKRITRILSALLALLLLGSALPFLPAVAAPGSDISGYFICPNFAQAVRTALWLVPDERAPQHAAKS